MPVGTAIAAGAGAALLKKAAVGALAKRAAKAAVGSAASSAGSAIGQGVVSRLTQDQESEEAASSDVLTRASDLAMKEHQKSERQRKLGNVAKVALLGPMGAAAAKLGSGPPRYGSLEIAN